MLGFIIFLIATLLFVVPIAMCFTPLSKYISTAIIALWLLFCGSLWFKSTATKNEWFQTVGAPTNITAHVSESLLLNSSPFSKVLADENGTIRIRITDGRTAYQVSHSDFSDNIFFDIAGNNIDLNKANFKFLINGEDKTSNLILDGSTLAYGETSFFLLAENSAGKIEKTLIVEKYSTYDACAKFDPDSTYKICQDYVSKADQEKKSAESTNNRGGNANNSNGSVCVHQENDTCWDDVESGGYSDGYWDGVYSSFKESYFESLPFDETECNSYCEELYEDAYYEGYLDGKSERE